MIINREYQIPFTALKKDTLDEMVNVKTADSMNYYVSKSLAGMILISIAYSIDISNMLTFISGYSISISVLYWYVFSIR